MINQAESHLIFIYRLMLAVKASIGKGITRAKAHFKGCTFRQVRGFEEEVIIVAVGIRERGEGEAMKAWFPYSLHRQGGGKYVRRGIGACSQVKDELSLGLPLPGGEGDFDAF